jgi:hypothetical protein
MIALVVSVIASVAWQSPVAGDCFGGENTFLTMTGWKEEIASFSSQ